MLNLKYSEDAIINKIFSYFEKVNIKSFYNVKGTKWYSTQEKLAFLVYKILNLKSYRDLSEIEING
ncbi:MAG: hypothetical protein KC550_01255, partial [Nanoarchaeota archaeon]|nr:hypothetical protein [Nanoarchaeota archaeon]